MSEKDEKDGEDESGEPAGEEPEKPEASEPTTAEEAPKADEDEDEDDDKDEDEDDDKDEDGEDDDKDEDGEDEEDDGEKKDETDDAEEPVAAKPTDGPPSQKGPERKPQAWGRPLARLDAAWTKWEIWLCAIVIVLEIVVLTVWVGLKGLSTPPDGNSRAGLVFRGLTGAIVVGQIAYWSLKKQSPMIRRIGTIAGTVVGIALAKTWGAVGVDWASNFLNWYQQASFLTLLGGLRGVGTRLTLLLALLGGSLATAAGKHITIDLVTRYLSPKARLPVVIAGWIGASAVCGIAAWGFFDHIAIDDFDAKAEMRPSEKIETAGKKISEHFFVARKQIALDFKTFPKVIAGQRYSEWMTGAEWNAWVQDAGFKERYGEKADLLKIPDDLKRSPIVLIPDKGEPRGELAKTANLVFPIGLFIIALRFILLALLALAGHKSVDPEAHGDIHIGDQKPKDEPPAPEEAR